MLKTAQIYFLLFLISLQSWGLFLVAPLAEASASFNFFISERNMTEVHFTPQAYRALKWHNQKEIIVNDHFYDVEMVKIVHDGFLVKLALDDFESKIMKKCFKIIQQLQKALHFFFKHCFSGFVAIISSVDFAFNPDSLQYSKPHNLWQISNLLEIFFSLPSPPPK